jgi:putative NIF3 family GTP cyclohydrolase 1 type 2
MPGSGGDAVGPAAEAGADVLICGDLQHHDALDARALGLAVIDAGHYATERPVVASLAAELRRRLGNNVRVIESQVNTDPFAGGAE